MRDIELPDGQTILRIFLGLPRRIANLFGFGYPDRFRIQGRDIVRPARFDTLAHRRAFAFVGSYVADPLSPIAMWPLQYRNLGQPYAGRPDDIVPETWDEVLRFFAQEGAIERRWELVLPTGREGAAVQSPLWGAEGEALDFFAEDDSRGWKLPDGTRLVPSRLTEEQRAGLIGKTYAVEPRRPDGAHPRRIALAPSHFHVLYVRPMSNFTADELEPYQRPSRG